MRALLLLILAGLVSACSPTRLFNGLAAVGSGEVQRIRDESYGPHARNRLDVYVPARGDGAPKPILVFLYGGSWSDGRKETYPFAALAFAGRGFVTVVPDYRLVPEVRYPTFLEDNAAAVRWARDNAVRFGADPNRIVLVGHSAGAYNAAMLALDQRWLDRAGVPRSSIRAWAGLAGPYDFLPLDDPATIAAFGRTPDLPATQPGAYVDRADPPAFLATGSTDERVAPRHTRDLAARLQAEGVPVETRFYPTVGHVGIVLALSSPFRGRAPVLDDVVGFLRARSGPAPAAGPGAD
ncbi:MAG: alpha/beta hydrolase [Pseudomonadota bacterium]|nr:alpha/beta hydrolase [Pseudomonadota bacterium]